MTPDELNKLKGLHAAAVEADKKLRGAPMSHHEDEACHAAIYRFESECRNAMPGMVEEMERLQDTSNHWMRKAECYGNIVHGCSPALAEAGFPVDASQNDGAVGGIRRSVDALCSENIQLRTALESAQRELAEARAELVELKGKLPKQWFTKDGVLLRGLTKVYHPDGRELELGTRRPLCPRWAHGNRGVAYAAWKCYSTREAALSAKPATDCPNAKGK